MDNMVIPKEARDLQKHIQTAPMTLGYSTDHSIPFTYAYLRIKQMVLRAWIGGIGGELSRGSIISRQSVTRLPWI